jgi:rSAM/selenodomain-associated transferase 1
LQYPDADLFIAYTPSEASDFFAAMYPRESLFSQQGSDLGGRMRHAFEELFARGFDWIVLVGGDLPVLPRNILLDAFNTLAERDSEIVLGPALDGGYYLVGMNRLISVIFTGIEWSRDDVLATTLRKLNSVNTRYKLLRSWYDVDTVADLRRVESDFSGTPPGTMEKTLRLLKKFREGGKLT